MTSLQTSPEQRYAAFRHKAFLSYWTARFLTTFATMVVSVAVGWQMYDLTRDPFDLGIVGIVQFLPSLLLVLVTGAVADRFGRRLIMALAVVVEAICALALLALTLRSISGPLPIFCVLAMFGVARAFFGPASASLFANLVPPEDFANAIAWNSSAWQTATIVGPVAGGLLYGVSPEVAYGTAAVLMLASGLLIFTIPKPAQRTETEKPTLQNLFGGFSYIWSEKIVLGAISLDLFAVLLSGASALLPVYARDILQLGPWGLGLLRSAPSIGAICVAVWLAGHPMRNHAGMIMLAAAASFGAFTVLFGLSTITWLSIAALVFLGATDMFSVYIRETLIQLWTPDEVRGRVNAVNQVFVGASNEVGEFRAGTMAALIGTVPAVVIGGVGAIAVAGLWMVLFPQLRKVRHLNGRN
ncbi:MFS transporter [Mesorhizobium japonicum]|uniref:Integral membrane protein, probable MFS transporter n=1 Tax=Mesorhizobium japonicum (strain LMG 29417 / CECT 9101 / MAFF 303099) TaxID=266835 RepID=Q98EJ4_RHILO|nr:MFS transporter [Mesorhizobium japonicum]BAB50924.1 integral membrane protein, probable MFS transporter [Mesorhizobium japonicum MAFF 303099]